MVGRIYTDGIMHPLTWHCWLCGVALPSQGAVNSAHQFSDQWMRVPMSPDLFAPGLECSWAFSEVGTDYRRAWPSPVVPDLLDGCLCPWNSPGKNTGVSCHFLLQGIFPTQGLNLHLLVSGIGTGRQVLWFFTTSPTCEAPREGRGDIKLEDKSSSLPDPTWELRGMSLPSQGPQLASSLFCFYTPNVLVWDWLS